MYAWKYTTSLIRNQNVFLSPCFFDTFNFTVFINPRFMNYSLLFTADIFKWLYAEQEAR